MADRISIKVLKQEEQGEELKGDGSDGQEQELVLDIEGVEAPVINALRRVCLSEVKTMAIEKVFIMQNTSIFPD